MISWGDGHTVRNLNPFSLLLDALIFACLCATLFSDADFWLKVLSAATAVLTILATVREIRTALAKGAAERAAR